jgi:hypothetical protein
MGDLHKEDSMSRHVSMIIVPLNRSGSSSCQQEADLTSNCFPPVNFFRYASEGIQAACDWAYKGVTEGDTLEGKESTQKTMMIDKRKKLTNT